MNAGQLSIYLAVPHLALTVWAPAALAMPALIWSRHVWATTRTLVVLAFCFAATVASGQWERQADGSLTGLHLAPVVPVALLVLWKRSLETVAGLKWLQMVAAACAMSWLSIAIGDVVQSLAVGQDLFYIGGSGLTDTLLLSPALALLGTTAIPLAARAKS